MTIAVVGSGPSGLAAAFRLQQAGHQVRLFEREAAPGGKMRTATLGGYLAEEGASVMSRAYLAILGVVAEAGLTDQLVEANATFGFARDGRVHYFDPARLLRDGATTKLLSIPAKLRLPLVAAVCLRHRRALSRGALVELAHLDDESASSYGTRLLGREAYDYLVDPALRGLAGCSPEDISRLDLLYCFNNFLGVPRFVAFRDGMGSYARLMAARFDTSLSSEVLAVEERPSDVRLTWRDGDGDEHTDSFAGCVLAAPAPVTRDVLAGLDHELGGFLDRVQYTKMINLNVGLNHAPTGVPASFIPNSTTETPDLIGIILEHNKVAGRVPAGRGHLVLGGATEFSERFWDSDDTKCADALFAEAEKVLPGCTSDVDFVHTTRWSPLVLQARPGYYRELAAFTTRYRTAYCRVALAGDFYCTGNVNTATAAGERAAATLTNV